MSYLKDFQNHVVNHNYPSFLKLWEEYCSGDEVDPDELKEILSIVKGSDIGEPFGRHVERIVPLWENLPPTDLSHEILRLIIDIQTTNNQLFATLATNCLHEKYSHEVDFNNKMRLIGLRNKDKFQGAISNYELLTHMKKGNFVFHSGGWGVGEIDDVSFMREQVKIEFDYVPGKKEISFSTAFKTLTPIPKDHFLALRFGHPDVLEKKAKESPVEVIRMLLRDMGPKTAAEIKEELCELVIPPEEWVRWWQGTRAKIKKDTLIETPEELKDPFRIRHSEMTHEDRLQKILENNPDTPSLIQTVYSFLKDFPEMLKNQEFKSTLIAKLKGSLAHSDLTHAQELQVYFLLQDLNGSKGDFSVTEIVKKISSFQELIESVPIVSFKKRVLIEIKRSIPDWKQIFLDLFFQLNQAPLRDYILTELIVVKADLEINQKLEELCTYPARYPEVFLWYFQKVMGEKAFPFSHQEGRIRYFEGLLILLSALENDIAYRDLVKKIHSLISNGRYAIVRKLMQEADMETVKEFLLLATKCHSLGDHELKILHSLAEVAHPTLSKVNKKNKSNSLESSVIWTTNEGFQLLQKRIQQIATTDTVQNAKEIEVARSHGDLRENAEFKAALEKRDRLQMELKKLSEQLNCARIITQEDISTEEVGIGAVVECKNTQGQIHTYTLLGPWEANPDQNILSFQSKLAQEMIGKSIGGVFQFQNEEYTITSIKSFL